MADDASIQVYLIYPLHIWVYINLIVFLLQMEFPNLETQIISRGFIFGVGNLETKNLVLDGKFWDILIAICSHLNLHEVVPS